LNNKLNVTLVKKLNNFTKAKTFLDENANSINLTNTIKSPNIGIKLHSVNPSSMNSFKISKTKTDFNSKLTNATILSSKNSRKSSKEKNTQISKALFSIHENMDAYYCKNNQVETEVKFTTDKIDKYECVDRIKNSKPKIIIKSKEILNSCNVMNLAKKISSFKTHAGAKKNFLKNSIQSNSKTNIQKETVYPNKNNFIIIEKKTPVIINSNLKFLDLSNSLNSVKKKINNTIIHVGSSYRNLIPAKVSFPTASKSSKLKSKSNSKSVSRIDEKNETKTSNIINKEDNLNKISHKDGIKKIRNIPSCKKIKKTKFSQFIKSDHNKIQLEENRNISLKDKLSFNKEKYKKIYEINLKSSENLKNNLFTIKTHPILILNQIPKCSESNTNIQEKKILNKSTTSKVIIKSNQFIDINQLKNKSDSPKPKTEENLDPVKKNNSEFSKEEELDSDISSCSNKIYHCKDNSYFQIQSEKIKNYITKYFNTHNTYPETNLKFYNYGRLLGRGAFGKVNLGLHKLSGRIVAIKTFNKSKLNSNSSKYNIYQETNLMKNLNHKNVIKIYEIFESTKYIFIIMENVCGGDLLTFLRKRTKINEIVAKFLFKQLIEAIKYIHSRNVIHRDIKLDNILIDLDNSIKICDFGVGKKIKKGQVLFDQCGTPAYIAPEILSEDGYEGFGVDVWSAGIVLYAMLKGTVPFKANNIIDLHNLIVSGKYQPIPNISDDAADLISGMLKVNPNNRMSIDEILNHRWLKIIDDITKIKSNLFTNAERILLAKSNVDYRKTNIQEICEHFSLKNLDTLLEIDHQNVVTNSAIYAPFNSTFKYILEDSFLDDELKIENEILKFTGKPKEANRQYELNNNGEIDNGFLINQNEKILTEKNKSLEKIYSEGLEGEVKESEYNFTKENLKISINDSLKKKQEKNNTESSGSINSHLILGKNILFIIKDNDIVDVIESLGYKQDYLIQCLNENQHNYATTAYFLLSKKELDL